MDISLKDRFISLWHKYFNNAELPLVFYYADKGTALKRSEEQKLPWCLIAMLARAREGQNMTLNADSIGCPGKRFCGFGDASRPNFEYFLSYGLPGKMEGERYVKNPDMVKQIVAQSPHFKAPEQFIVFKRWDKLEVADTPEVVVFFAQPDVLAGLFTLARFDDVRPDAVIVPFGSGCSTIVQYPYREKGSEHPRAVIGMFDASARPFVPKDVLTFSVPIRKLTTMIDNMEESFLITDSWQKIQKRIS